jgi:hypothetical protein
VCFVSLGLHLIEDLFLFLGRQGRDALHLRDNAFVEAKFAEVISLEILPGPGRILWRPSRTLCHLLQAAPRLDTCLAPQDALRRASRGRWCVLAAGRSKGRLRDGRTSALPKRYPSKFSGSVFSLSVYNFR